MYAFEKGYQFNKVKICSCGYKRNMVLKYPLILKIKNKEVLLPSLTFVATANAIYHSGGIQILLMWMSQI